MKNDNRLSPTPFSVAEARAVRERVGIADVSTLGKFEIAGPDARPFLDRLYINNVSALLPGRSRYGVMLREDGMVFDNGIIGYLDNQRFFVTTTTANAEAVDGGWSLTGETVYVADPVRGVGEPTPATVVNPCFHDPEGARPGDTSTRRRFPCIMHS